MSRVSLILLFLHCSFAAKTNLQNLKPVFIENQHLNIGTVINLEEVKKSIHELLNVTTHLQEDKQLHISLQQHKNIGLHLGKWMLPGTENRKFHVFTDIKERASHLIEHLESLCPRKKRWDVLGDILNELTGVPSSSMHNTLKDKLETLNTEVNTIALHGLEMNKELQATNVLTNRNINEIRKLTDTVHYSFQELERIERNQVATFNMLNYYTNANAILELSQQQITRTESTMIRGLSHRADRFSIPPHIISSAIQHMNLSSNITPVFNLTGSYYKEAITRVTCHGLKVFVTMRIPLININERRNLTLLSHKQKKSAKVDLTPFSFILINQHRQIHSYLTLSDFQKCLETKNRYVCNKRDIEIDNKEMGNLLIYDITPHRIIMHGTGEGHATCNRKMFNFILTTPVISLIPERCQVTHEHFMIHKTHLNDFEYTKEEQTFDFAFNYTSFDPQTNKQQLTALDNIQKNLIQLQEKSKELLVNQTIKNAIYDEAVKNFNENLLKQADEHKQHLHGLTLGLATGGTIIVIISCFSMLLIKQLKNLLDFKKYAEDRLKDKN